MSNLCKTTLCTTVQSVVNSTACTSSVEDILFNTISVDKIEPTNRISKVTFNGLPDTSTLPNGHVAYLDDAKVPVIASNGSWIGLDGRIVGTFVTNQIFAWGGNSGSLGDGAQTDRCSPVREFCSATDWCQVSAGNYHTSAIKTSGQLWAWGSGTCGALGDGTTVARCSSVREFCSATDWCVVSVGNTPGYGTSSHTTAVKTTGELWVWGRNDLVQLGDGTQTARCSPVREFCSASDWCGVSAGNQHSAAIKTTGQIWTWGNNIAGRLGDGTQTARCSPVREICFATDWCQVSAGEQHTAAIKTSGQIWAWGLGSNGRLGDGTTTSRTSPVREISSSTDWCQVSARSRQTAAIKTSGQIWAWGRNLCGEIGDGTLTTRTSPVREFCSATDWCAVDMGGFHTAAVKTSGQLWTWGFNDCGRLGDGTTVLRCSPVREISSSTDWCQVSAGNRRTSAIKIITGVCR